MDTRERDRASNFTEEAHGSLSRVEQRHLEIRPNTRQDHSREAGARAYVEDRARLRKEAHARQCVDDVLSEKRGAIAIARQAKPRIPDVEEIEKAGDASRRNRIEVQPVDLAGQAIEQRLLCLAHEGFRTVRGRASRWVR